MRKLFCALSITSALMFINSDVYAGCVGTIVMGECQGTVVRGYGESSSSYNGDSSNNSGYSSTYNQSPRYESNSGAEYKYDLNDPGDKINYQFDYDAQRRDSLSADPRRSMDQRSGQYGGGIYD